MTKDKITDIGVTFKENSPIPMLVISNAKWDGPCFAGHQYVVDAEADKVTCRVCDMSFNPMAVLVELAHKESRYLRHHEIYNEEMARLAKRAKTKCYNCGKMTRISST